MPHPPSRQILILGASYGSLLGAKLMLAGHQVALVCLPNEVEAINQDGIRVRMPVKGRTGLVEIDSRAVPGAVRALGPDAVDPADYDLICLAMQEPQYRAPSLRPMIERIASSGKPCMSIMNMPPLPYMRRLPGVDQALIRHCYADASVWDLFNPENVTLCSPDPQAFRPPEEPVNVLQVSLPTNFKAARFHSPVHQALLKEIAESVDAVRFDIDGQSIELPVKLKVHDALFVPLAKWSMLLTGNYRCVQPNEMRAIKDAVHSDPAASARVYEWVRQLCLKIGAADADLVPFEKYAAAAQGLAKPSSAARALAAGAVQIERVDRLVQAVAAQVGMRSDDIDATVALVESWLTKNRAAAKP